MPTAHRPSLAVRRALRKLGEDINIARRQRGLTMEVLADRAFTTRQTLQRVEAGNGMVAISIYAAVLQGLGHTKLESTIRYLGVEVDDALALSEQVDL